MTGFEASRDVRDKAAREQLKQGRGVRRRSRRDLAGTIDIPASIRGLTIADIPDLDAQFDPAMNDGRAANEIRASSRDRVTWHCERGHTWQAQVVGRATRGARCPYCFGMHHVAPEDSLAALFPALAAEWHPERNRTLRPDAVRPQSNRVVWWICSDGHAYRRKIEHRAIGGFGCTDPAHRHPLKTSAGARRGSNERHRRVRRLARAGEQLLAGDQSVTGEYQRVLDTAALNAARALYDLLVERLGRELLAELVNRAPRTMEQARRRRIAIPVARRLEHLAAIVEGLGHEADAEEWFTTPHARLGGQRPEQLLVGEWEPVLPGPATILMLASTSDADAAPSTA